MPLRRKNLTEEGKKFKADYEESVNVMFKLLMKEKHVPSVYRVRELRDELQRVGFK